ncbi:CDP-glycerol glycerophosphotransferase family protein [Aeromicrobium terrae]|uniref:CDP-glycerol glycerophosphotransferase n=1 Tax=Aeromicrobium terrae TaxID=2498846 RepID=A0A5C8NL32_9ACTN|nr:CDP-glycerol glycerophosphotransferase family protein [Aeromicrobium terrae]TXL61860.1 hypothetical protein FHP06_03810 [Aeromicrobium terrae]
MSRFRALLSRLGSSDGLLALVSTIGLLGAAAVTALARLEIATTVLLLLSVLGEIVLARRGRSLREILDQAALGIPMRFVLRVVVGVLAATDLNDADALRAFVAVALVYALALCGRELHREYRRVGPLRPMRSRNITGSPSISVAPPPRVVEVVVTQLAVLAPALLEAPAWLVGALGAAAIVYLAAVTLPDARRSWRMRQAKRATGFTPPLRAVQDFIDSYRPEVVVHLSGPMGSAYQINTWLDALESLRQPVMILLRDEALFDTMRRTSLPTLELRDAGEFLQLDFHSVKVALYPSNTGNNIHLLRLPQIVSAFIGHGDSDKSASANPFSRVYDELWVAGEAGADRYRRSGLGVHEDQYRMVGRPQVHSIEVTPRLGDEEVSTVLYAPTWEGVNPGQEYSSIAAIGATLVSALLAADPPVRVIYKPHPFTGQRDAKYRDHDARIAALIDSAAQRSGVDHRVVRSGPIEHWFNQAAVLATDISSVVSDFLASEKPYAVFNHTDLDDEAFGDAYRSASGGIILGRDGRGIDELVALVTRRTADRRVEIRARLATYLLGPPEMRTLESFQDAVDALVARSDAERAIYREES